MWKRRVPPRNRGQSVDKEKHAWLKGVMSSQLDRTMGSGDG